MEVRNIKSNRIGTIDLEINHPVHGWIPFTASPDDVEQFGRDLYAEIMTGTLGAIAPYVATQEETDLIARKQADATALTQAKADATIKYLVTHTPAEITTKVRQLVNAAGVTNLSTAQVSLTAIEDLLVRIAIALSVAAKDRLR